ncbi:hypothetical protein VTN00DRAFT_1423 [Thermoascus crustaceus]|uniref:uncharacterized protein n=1 Tax=Thermoascus crustaceus TaxID=5088 RepID=UPI00374345BE
MRRVLRWHRPEPVLARHSRVFQRSALTLEGTGRHQGQAQARDMAHLARGKRYRAVVRAARHALGLSPPAEAPAQSEPANQARPALLPQNLRNSPPGNRTLISVRQGRRTGISAGRTYQCSRGNHIVGIPIHVVHVLRRGSLAVSETCCVALETPLDEQYRFLNSVPDGQQVREIPSPLQRSGSPSSNFFKSPLSHTPQLLFHVPSPPPPPPPPPPPSHVACVLLACFPWLVFAVPVPRPDLRLGNGKAWKGTRTRTRSFPDAKQTSSYALFAWLAINSNSLAT